MVFDLRALNEYNWVAARGLDKDSKPHSTQAIEISLEFVDRALTASLRLAVSKVQLAMIPKAFPNG